MSGWYRVPLDDGTFGWADSALLKQAEGASVVTSSQRTQIPGPIQFRIEGEDELQVTRKSAIRILGDTG